MILRQCIHSFLRVQGSGRFFRHASCNFSRVSQAQRHQQNISNIPALHFKQHQVLNCVKYVQITCCVDYSCNGRGKISRQKDFLKGALHKRQESLRKAEEQLKTKGKVLLKNIKEERSKMKAKVEELKEAEEQLKTKGKVLLKNIKAEKTRMKAKVEELIERENIWTIPNLLCIFRISLSPWLGYLILEESYNLAVGVLVCAGISDLLDGWIARNFKNQSSKLGSFLDPIADKILVATMFLTLTFVDIMPISLTSLIIVRDVGLVGAASYIRYKSLPPPRTVSKYFDLTLATVQLAPTFISKVNTSVQLATVAITLGAPIFDYTDHIALQSLWCLTAFTTVASAVSYVYARNTYKFTNGRKIRKTMSQGQNP
ncbi:unnamed protein product [Bemisia tabaci]|uniref:cardiolipin synthase (CMP-forming) n=1 Tax=Bemisia tabaci TaxID=7038 RepID=A0A9P0G455_BEMTA|nr:unnamed protein product [Bemisia tabaci]